MSKIAIMYEVTAQVREDLCDRFEAYMIERHIPDVIATGFFSSASFERAAQGKYRAGYRTGTRQELDRYLREQAPTLREHVPETFPEGVTFERAEWNILAEF